MNGETHVHTTPSHAQRILASSASRHLLRLAAVVDTLLHESPLETPLTYDVEAVALQFDSIDIALQEIELAVHTEQF